MNQKKPLKPKSSRIYDKQFKLSYLKPMYWGTWIAAAFLWLTLFFPRVLLDELANKLGDVFRRLNKKRSRIARINIDLCFPELKDEEKDALIKNSFRHQARSILYYGIIWWAPKSSLQKRIVFKGQDNIEKSFANKRSVIFMAAHSLGLEAAVSAVTLNYPSSGPFNPMKNKLVDWLVVNGRSRHGGILYNREAGLRPIIKDVRSGCTMFYLPDEDLGAERSIFAKFFGVEKATVPVLGRLAKSCNADVLPTMACYDDKQRRYVIHVLPPLKNFPSGDDNQDALAMNKALEKIIRICPSQYFWVMKLFKTRPDGKSKLY
ncbi:hypothetical protein MNBD_GAMMA07-2643 [hydrothermal vent metagenome]|uniref:Lipid A biosynthesis lauroyl acyltransferase n=1 Tax=hydrothermal vent metagenome TaxID=652676 RepID=A0A3B0WZ03_9ZZZZ